MTPSLRQEPALRQRTLPDLDDTEALLDFAAATQRDDTALAALCDRPALARAVVALVEPADLLRRQLSELGTLAIEERRDGGAYSVTEIAAVTP